MPSDQPALESPSRPCARDRSPRSGQPSPLPTCHELPTANPICSRLPRERLSAAQAGQRRDLRRPVHGRPPADRLHPRRPGLISRGRARKLARRASRKHRTDWGGWRGVTAFTLLARVRHPLAPRLVRSALANSDAKIAGAAVRALGDIGGDWAIGYTDHTADVLRLYLQESFTFRALAPEAAVPLRYARDTKKR